MQLKTTEKMVDVSIILVNYNTVDLTRSCIDSIVLYTHGCSYEILLVDNHSTDGSKELFEKDKRIRYFYQAENLGFGKANNIGFREAQGSYFLCLNTDTLLVEDSISMMFRQMETKRIGVLGVKLVNKEGRMMHSYCPFTPSIQWELYYGVYPFGVFINLYYRLKILLNKEISVGYITGADLMISKEVIDSCGMYDPDFFMYFEEAEMQRRFRAKGYKSYYFPGTQIIHLEGQSNSFKERREKMFLTSRNLYYCKTHHKLSYSIADYIYKSSLQFKRCFYSIIRNKEKSKDILKKLQMFERLKKCDYCIDNSATK